MLHNKKHKNIIKNIITILILLFFIILAFGSRPGDLVLEGSVEVSTLDGYEQLPHDNNHRIKITADDLGEHEAFALRLLIDGGRSM